jgi:hypothetical protein
VSALRFRRTAAQKREVALSYENVGWHGHSLVSRGDRLCVTMFAAGSMVTQQRVTMPPGYSSLDE